MSKPFYIICGPSGSGKSSICRALGLRQVLTATTRQRRPNEPVDAYYFMSREEFESTPMLETEKYCGALYGTPVDALREADIGVYAPAGVAALKKYCHSIERKCVCFYITVPENIRVQRMQKRGDSEDLINARLESDRKAFSHLLLRGRCDHIIDNSGEGIADAIRRIQRLL